MYVVILLHSVCITTNYSKIIGNFIDIRESVGDRSSRENFEQFVARKYYVTKQDVTNTSRRVHDCTIIGHQSDRLSVAQVVSDGPSVAVQTPRRI